VKVALVIEVLLVRTKSSADSISNGAVSGRVAVAIFPSGFPVLKKKDCLRLPPPAAQQGSRSATVESRSARQSSTLLFSPQRGFLAADDAPWVEMFIM
jgi:hypothetical protein